MILAAATTALPIDLTALLLILVAAWTAGGVATRLGYPAVLGELLAGIVLGPPLLGVLSGGEGLSAVGELGIILMMLYIGTEIEIEDLKRSSRAGLYAAVGGFVVPFGLGAGLILLLGYDWIAAVFVGSAMGVTSLATKSRILADLRLFDTRIAYVLMAAALLSDTATLVIFAGVLSLAGGTLNVASTATVALEAVAFFVLMWVAGRTVLPWLGHRLVRPGGAGVVSGMTMFIGVGLGASVLAEQFGLHPILGAFVAGLFLRGSLPERTTRAVSHQIERISIGVLAPVFFVMAGFEISLSAAAEQWGVVLAVIVVATVGKILGTALAYLPTGHGWREGTVVGAAMNGRGAVEIIVAGIGLEAGLISQEIFTVLVLMAIITTALVPVMLKKGVDWLRRHGELDETTRRRGVVIVGAGPVGRSLAEAFGVDREVHLIDANPERCGLARAAGFDVVRGDALDPDVLQRAHIEDAGLFVALTPNVEVNVLAATLAFEEFGVPVLRIGIPKDRVDRTSRLIDHIPAQPLLDHGLDVAEWEDHLRRQTAREDVLVIDEAADGPATLGRLQTGEAGFPLTLRRAGETIPFALVGDLRPGDEITLLVPDVPTEDVVLATT